MPEEQLELKLARDLKDKRKDLQNGKWKTKETVSLLLCSARD